MLTRALKQRATYWAPTGQTDRYGKPVLETPAVLNVRWEDRQSQIISKTGTEIISKTRVFTLESIDPDGYFAYGEFTDADPRALDVAREVQAVSTTPDLRNLKSLTTVYL